VSDGQAPRGRAAAPRNQPERDAEARKSRKIERDIADFRRSTGDERDDIICYTLSMDNDPRVVAELLPLMADPDVRLRRDVAEALRCCVCLGPDGEYYERRSPLANVPGLVSTMVRALNDREYDVREHAATILGNCDAPEALDALLKALSDPDSGVRTSVILSLGNFGDPRAKPFLSESLRDDKREPYERRYAAQSLGRLGDPSALNLLADVLKDKNEPAEVRVGAAEGLRSMRDKRAVPILLAVAKAWADHPRVRFEAAVGLTHILDGAVADADVVVSVNNFYWPNFFHEVTDFTFERMGHERQDCLEMIAKNGTTAAVRAVAKNPPPPFWQQEEDRQLAAKLKRDAARRERDSARRRAVLIVSLAYYPVALAFWVFGYRHSLRRHRVPIGSIFILAGVIAVGVFGIPAVVSSLLVALLGAQ
jgi:hypothetical protein